jgi:hypothetical protein
LSERSDGLSEIRAALGLVLEANESGQGFDWIGAAAHRWESSSLRFSAANPTAFRQRRRCALAPYQVRKERAVSERSRSSQERERPFTTEPWP